MFCRDRVWITMLKEKIAIYVVLRSLIARIDLVDQPSRS